MQKLGDVETVRGMTRDRFFADFFGQKPVVLRGAISHWPALREWSPESFRRLYGETRAWVEYYDPGSDLTFLDQRLAFISKEVVLGDFLASLSSGGQPYAIRESQGLFEKHPQLLADMDYFRPFGWQEEETEPFIALWVGPAGSLTGMHIDIGESQLFQLYGRKRFVLFAPDQTPLLYEEILDEKLRQLPAEAISHLSAEDLAIFRDFMRWSAVNPVQPDHRRFPLLEQARYRDAWVEPGDVVYVPSGWWHAVQSLTPSISVTKTLCETAFLRAAAA